MLTNARLVPIEPQEGNLSEHEVFAHADLRGRSRRAIYASKRTVVKNYAAHKRHRSASTHAEKNRLNPEFHQIRARSLPINVTREQGGETMAVEDFNGCIAANGIRGRWLRSEKYHPRQG